MAHIFVVGRFLEVVIVAEAVVAVEGVIKRDRAGQPEMRYRDATAETFPVLAGSEIQLTTGQAIQVPQDPAEVAKLMAAALERETVLPAGWPA